MQALRLANIVYANEPMIAIDHGGELLSVRALEERLDADWSLSQFTDQANVFRHRVFSLGMAGLNEIAGFLGDCLGPRAAVLNRARCLFLPPTVECSALAEFSIQGENEAPQFRWGNSRCLLGHESILPIPCDEPSPEITVQIGTIIMEDLHYASVEESAQCIAGLAPLSLWTFPSRDRVLPGWGSFRLGQLGPCLVQTNSTDPKQLAAAIRVNGRTVARTLSRPQRMPIAEMVARASEAARLAPGDIIASGPLVRASGKGGQFLADGDRIEAEVGDLGTLAGMVVRSLGRSRYMEV